MISVAGLAVSSGGADTHPSTLPGQNPVLNLVAFHRPWIFLQVPVWRFAAPGVRVVPGPRFVSECGGSDSSHGLGKARGREVAHPDGLIEETKRPLSSW